MRTIFSVSMLIMFSGCTSLSTRTEQRTADTSLAVEGVPYSLPMLQFEVKITRTLTQCVEPGTTDHPHLLFSAKVEATPHYVPGETYSLDYTHLAGFTKITSTAIETYEGGTLHTVNASAEDRSAQIIQATVKTAVGIAALAAGIPPIPAVAGGPPGEREMLVCAAGTQELLDAVKQKTADLKNATANLDRLTERITLLTEQARLNSISDAGRQELTGPGGLIEQQREAALTVATDQTKVDRAQAAVSSAVQIRWPRDIPDRREAVPLDDASLDRLAHLVDRVPFVAGDNGTDNECGTVDDPAATAVRHCLQSKLAIGLTLDPIGPGSHMPALQSADPAVINPADGAEGIFIRPPGRGRLLACQLGGTSACADGSRDTLLRTDDAAVPQFGQLRFLRFRNEAFQNNALALSLRTDGSIEKFEYREVSARGETVANSAANTVGQIQGLAQGLRSGRAADQAEAAAQVTASRNASLASLQFEIDRLTRQQQLDHLSQPSDTSQLTAVQAETAQVNARVALLQAELAERNAQAALVAAPH